MSLLLSLARYFVHSNLPTPLRLLTPFVTQTRHKSGIRRPPKLPPISDENEEREDYWGAVLEYLDPPVVSKNRTKSAGSSHKRQLGTFMNLDPVLSEPIQPIKRVSNKQKRQKVKSKPISDLGFDIEPDGLFTSILSKPTQATDVQSQAIIDAVTGTIDGTKDGDSSLSIEDVIRTEKAEEKNEVSSQTGTEVSETGTEELQIGTEVSQTGNEVSETGTEELVTGTKVSQIETEEPEPKFLELLRESNWMKMGDPRKKTLRGIVINQIGSQVYVDYGHKFHGVFKIPEEMEPNQFQTGTKLLVRITELELTQHFLGEDEIFSLLESGIEFVSLSTT